jgi:hypothetical protein
MGVASGLRPKSVSNHGVLFCKFAQLRWAKIFLIGIAL